ncbi:hypothetical protein Val02_88640 [Virgisporangium aliadipatigenens]|uniref:Uncharacterized protein n=1 Tax=Virgisporangium aliadipatigenens TaxID=741659 RepID=A0A8J3YWQ2_9ACTN|nr:hypothetical protein [Virgisporangium aliadipatigenens]GIJ51978.1 hypothetical protein Val02_88640 [Virgisporangium aliadipatigenens]
MTAPRVLDATALTALFAGHPTMIGMLTAAEADEATLLLPTTAISDAEAAVRTGTTGWEAILPS